MNIFLLYILYNWKFIFLNETKKKQDLRSEIWESRSKIEIKIWTKVENKYKQKIEKISNICFTKYFFLRCQKFHFGSFDDNLKVIWGIYECLKTMEILLWNSFKRVREFRDFSWFCWFWLVYLDITRSTY